MATSRRLGEVFYEVRGRVTGLEKDLQSAERQFGQLTTFVKANPVAAVTAVGVAAAGMAVKAIRAAAEMESAMRRVKAAIPDPGGITALRKEVDLLANASGRSA